MWGKGKEGKGRPAEALRTYLDQEAARKLGQTLLEAIQQHWG